MGVFVLGMHRSGTSAVARTINALGVPLGDPADALPPAPDNPDGFAESTTLVAVNEHILDLLGGRWDAPPPMPPGWATGAPVALELIRAGELFTDVHAADRWVWKDPRTCLTAPFWDLAIDPPTGGRAHKVVVVFRNPLAVARSLGRRDSLSKTYSLALWERYCRSALAFAAGRPTLMADFDRLAGDPVFRSAWLVDAGAFVDGETDEADRRGRPFGGSAVDPGRIHHAIDETALDRDGEISAEQRELYRAMARLPQSVPALTLPDLPPETARTEPRFAEHRQCDPNEDCVHCKLGIEVPWSPPPTPATTFAGAAAF